MGQPERVTRSFSVRPTSLNLEMSVEIFDVGAGRLLATAALLAVKLSLLPSGTSQYGPRV